MIHLSIQPPKESIYLDHASTTPVDPDVFQKMQPYFTEVFGNPSSLHQLGVEAKTAMEEARTRIGYVLGSSGSEIIFTSGGTESINLALQGVVRAHNMKGKIITQPTEHHAVLRTLEYLEEQGINVVRLPVDQDGFVSPKDLTNAIDDKTILVSIMYAQNEIGTVQPLKDLVAAVRAKQGERHIPFHTDACQASGQLPLNVEELGVDLMSLNGSKMYGPKSSGILYVRQGTRIKPVMFGGNQERALRSGTEDVPGIVGLSYALEMAEKMRESESTRLAEIRNFMIQELEKIEGVALNGSRESRLANNVHINVAGIDGEALVTYLNDYKIFCSTGSACTSSEVESSHVLQALGQSPKEADSSLRFTLGRSNTMEQAKYVTEVARAIIERLREVAA